MSATTGHVRIDDDESTVFGETKRDQLFIVQVTLNISAAGATAKVVLSGAGASGEATRNLLRRLFQSRDSLAESAYRLAYRRTIQRFLPPTSSLREKIRDNVRLSPAASVVTHDDEYVGLLLRVGRRGADAGRPLYRCAVVCGSSTINAAGWQCERSGAEAGPHNG